MKRISTNDLLFRRRLQHLTKAKNLAALLAACVLAASAARADSQTGHITRITYVGNTVMIMLDTGPPPSCSGTPFGWMMVPASYTSMIAFVSGVWFRGDAAAKSLGVYTSGLDGSGYCQISQIDTQSAG